jgi:hypothetical protein
MTLLLLCLACVCFGASMFGAAKLNWHSGGFLFLTLALIASRHWHL